MECYVNNKWMIVSTSSPNLDGGARGLFATNPLVGVVDPHLCLAVLTVSPKSTEFPADAIAT